MPYTPLADVRKFHDTFSPNQRGDDFLTKTERRIKLITEEYEELTEAIVHLEDTRLNLTSSTLEEAKEEVAKEMADVLYVIYGTADELGIPVQQVFAEVHKSNMSKVWPDGTVRYNDYGKVLKPDNYKKPDLSFIHDNQFLQTNS